MSQLTYQQVAATVLAEIRAIFPTGMKPDEATVEAWARVIGRSHLQVPAALWREAVTTWAVSHSDPPSPHDLVATGKQVIAQWEADPSMRQRLNEFRQERLASKFGAGYGAEHAGQIDAEGQGAIEPPREQTRQRWAELKAEIRTRALERRTAERPAPEPPDPPGDAPDD